MYSITAAKSGFYENSDICESAGGYLATVTNVLDQESLNGFIKKSNSPNEQFFWIGKFVGPGFASFCPIQGILVLGKC